MPRFLALLLVGLLLLGSAGVPVSRHYCRGELKSLAVFGTAEACHAPARQRTCPFHPPAGEEDAPERKSKDCCDDEQDIVKVDETDERGSDVLVDIPTLAGGGPTAPPSLKARHLRFRPLIPYPRYRPPPLIVDVPRLYQVFRI